MTWPHVTTIEGCQRDGHHHAFAWKMNMTGESVRICFTKRTVDCTIPAWTMRICKLRWSSTRKTRSIVWITLHDPRTSCDERHLMTSWCLCSVKDVVFDDEKSGYHGFHAGLHPDFEEDRCHLCQQKEDQQLATVNVLPRFSHHRPGRWSSGRSDPFSPYNENARSKTHWLGLTGNGLPQNCMGFSDHHRTREYIFQWLFDGYLMVYPIFRTVRCLPVFGIPFVGRFLSSVRRALAANDAPDEAISWMKSLKKGTIFHQ